VFTHKITV